MVESNSSTLVRNVGTNVITRCTPPPSSKPIIWPKTTANPWTPVGVIYIAFVWAFLHQQEVQEGMCDVCELRRILRKGRHITHSRFCVRCAGQLTRSVAQRSELCPAHVNLPAVGTMYVQRAHSLTGSFYFLLPLFLLSVKTFRSVSASFPSFYAVYLGFVFMHGGNGGRPRSTYLPRPSSYIHCL